MSWTADNHHYEQRGSHIYVDGRMAGWITRLANGTRVFVSPRQFSHKFRNLNGWGISKALLFDYIQKIVGIEDVHLKVGKTLTLMSKLEDWKKHGIDYHKEPFELQVILPEPYFKRDQMTMAEALG